MPDIQERLSDCLRLPQAGPALHAQVFLCFRVLLLRMSSHHVTSLWPVVVSELVQAMMHMEHQLAGDRCVKYYFILLLHFLDLVNPSFSPTHFPFYFQPLDLE